MSEYEKAVIEFEAARSDAKDKWYEARPLFHRTLHTSAMFDAGFRMAWELNQSSITTLEQQLAESADTEQVLINTRNMAAEKFAEYKKQIAGLEHQLAQERWIPVSERLHDNRAKPNLGRTDAGGYVICYHDELGFSMPTNTGNRYISNVTHVQSINAPSEVRE